ncbi:hypothetical protein JXB37_07435 [candidate division WOR-3 bacterium]|nr:hypothetical protein [candidate division WOR-3 bacterium]
MLRHVFRLAILALVATAVPGQSLDKVIPLGSVGSTMRYPWLMALDTSSNRLFVTDEEAMELLAIDGTTHERVAWLQLRECDWCLGLLALPGYNRVCVVAEVSVSFIDAAACTLVAQHDYDDADIELVGGGCNPANGKVYCAFEDSVLVFDGATGELRTRLAIGYTDEYDDWMPFAASPASNKVYFHACDDDTWIGVVVVDGAGDSVVARVSLDPCSWVSTMCYDDRNDIVWCGVEDSCVRVIGIDCRTDSIVADIPLGDESYPTTMTYDSVHDRVYCATDGSGLAVIDAGGRRLRVVENVRGWITRLAVGQHGRKLYCADEDYGELLVYDLDWEQFVDEVEGVSYAVALAWNPLTAEVCCVDYDWRAVLFIDPGRDSLVARTSTWAVPHSPVFDAANLRLSLVGPDPDVVSVVDTRDDVFVGEVDVGFNIAALCWNESSRLLFAGGTGANSVAVIDPAAMEVVGTLRVHDPDTLVTCGDRVYCCGSMSDGVTVLAGDGSRVLDTIPLGFRADGCLLSCETGRLYVVGRGDEGLAVVDLAAERLLAVLPLADGRHELLAESPAEGRLYCQSGGELVSYDTRGLSVRPGPVLGGVPTSLCTDPASGQVLCGLTSGELVRIDPRVDTVAGRLGLPEVADALGIDRNSGLACWVGESLVGFVDGRTFKARGALPVSGVLSHLVCDEIESRVFVLSVSSVVAIRGPEQGPDLWSATGPSLVGRTVRLYGSNAAALHDVTGRRVMSLVPGENRLLGLAPGTYFLVQDGRGGAQKVVLPR